MRQATSGAGSEFMRKTTRNVLLISAVVLALLITGFVIARVLGILLEVFYVALIILASLLLISTAMLIYALLLAMQTFATVTDELNPLIHSLQHTVETVTESVEETAGTVKDTAKSVGQTATAVSSTARLTQEYAFSPSVRAVAFLVGGQQMLRVFLGKGRTRHRYEERRQQQMELIESSTPDGGK
jgi:methyl-accepting chemotaxis protein